MAAAARSRSRTRAKGLSRAARRAASGTWGWQRCRSAPVKLAGSCTWSRGPARAHACACWSAAPGITHEDPAEHAALSRRLLDRLGDPACGRAARGDLWAARRGAAMAICWAAAVCSAVPAQPAPARALRLVPLRLLSGADHPGAGAWIVAYRRNEPAVLPDLPSSGACVRAAARGGLHAAVPAAARPDAVRAAAPLGSAGAAAIVLGGWFVPGLLRFPVHA